MNINKFTQKSIEAVQDCEKLAYQYGNPEIDQEHFLYSLLTVSDSLILKLIEKMEIQKAYFVNRAEQAVQKRVKVQGGNPYIGQYLNKVLITAEDEISLEIMSKEDVADALLDKLLQLSSGTTTEKGELAD